ncbi:MAG TPA: hypothetical protein VLV81_10570 [Acidimicrobiia bacterium]|nr:hypothetical protein [Acidimicrobiia bacterium]
MMSNPNWAEVLTAVATAVGALGLLGAIGAAFFAAQQVREARHSRQAQMAADFLRRWDEDALVETRHLVASYKSGAKLAAAFQGFIEKNSVQAFVLYRELDYFEQLGALESVGAFNFELIRVLLGRRLIDRWELWKPSIDAMGDGTYPMFEMLVNRMRTALGDDGPVGSR